MAAGNFPACLSAVLRWEGGYVDHPSDPGGATNMGITRKTLAAWRHVVPWTSLPKSAVQALTVEEAGRIYRANYWDAVSGDDLPAGVDLAVFDFAVNSGPAKAAIVLQTILGVATDGRIGPLTLAALRKRTASEIVTALCAQRLAFLERLSTWPTFGRGWSTRVNGIRDKALAMAGGSTAAPAPVPRAPEDRPTAAAGSAGSRPEASPPGRRAASPSPVGAILAALVAAFGGVGAILQNDPWIAGGLIVAAIAGVGLAIYILAKD